jgi:hypothetical protein
LLLGNFKVTSENSGNLESLIQNPKSKIQNLSARRGVFGNHVKQYGQKDEKHCDRSRFDPRFNEGAGLAGATSSGQVPGEYDRPKQQGANAPP